MKTDISSIREIKLLVDTFYEKVKKDSTIGPIFTEKSKIDWEKHLPVMYKFWENILFYTGSYQGNPMEVHQHVHDKIGLSSNDFKVWLYLFEQTTDDLFSGDNANRIKQRAKSIATVMEIKILYKGTD